MRETRPLCLPLFTCSQSGELNTRSSPNSSFKSTEQRKTPPNATSSPKTTAVGSVAMATRMASLMAVNMFICTMGCGSSSARSAALCEYERRTDDILCCWLAMELHCARRRWRTDGRMAAMLSLAAAWTKFSKWQQPLPGNDSRTITPI